MKRIIYDENLSKNYNTFHDRNGMQIDIIDKVLGLDYTKKILDVGCGSGRLLKKFNLLGYNVDGVEYSENMFFELNSQFYNEPKPQLYHDDYNNFVNNTKNKYDCAYFSYSLHQISPDKAKQIELIRKTFGNLGCDKILLITSSRNQFNESVLNINSEKLHEIDLNRFLFKDELEKHFKVSYYLEETIYKKITKKELLNLVDNKYISTLQLLSDVEFDSLKRNIDERYSESIVYPDYYTYILLEA